MKSRTISAVAIVAVAAAGMAVPAQAAGEKVTVCHINGTGDYNDITIAEAAFTTHVSHGDGVPGDPIPGLTNYVFGPDCAALYKAPVIVYPPVIVLPPIISAG